MVRPSALSSRLGLLAGASVMAMIVSTPAHADMLGRRTADPATQVAKAAADSATASTATRRTLEAFTRASAIRQQMDTAQNAARAAALAAQSSIPNGLGVGGLQVANGVALDPSLWIGANGPTQAAGSDGRTTVTVDQIDDKAILSWDSFNVGRETDLVFDQKGNTNWVALNRVADVNADPTKILGTVKADGSLYIINRNGILFGGASQVNTRNLIAFTADISNIQFKERGIYLSTRPNPNWWEGDLQVASFVDAGGAVRVEAGARIVTSDPTTVVEAGGFVLLMGTEVENAGSIMTNRGQTILAAGDSFLTRPGYGTDVNQGSTTRGLEVAVEVRPGSTSGLAVNSGLIQSTEGDITIAGERVVQAGVAISTTSVNTRGTIHLLTNVRNEKTDTSVTLKDGSLTLILPELDSDATATNAQRDALVSDTSNSRPSFLNNQAHGSISYLQPDRKDVSRVEIVTGGTAVFEGGSQTIAQGGQIAVTARKRAFVAEGALLDVSGVRDVAMDMESNNLLVNIQPYELRDSALNREGENLKSNNVWVDVRDLILLPSGTGGYEGDRYYTPGGLIEVGGYLGNAKHKIGEWAAQGGTIIFTSGMGNLNVTPKDIGELVIQKGAVFNISGGSLNYADGYIQSTRFLGSDGKIYEMGQAPAGVKMMAIGDGFIVEHRRVGAMYTEIFSDPLFNRATSIRKEEGYIAGRDAGVLTLSVPSVVFEGDIIADVIVGDRQTNARPDLPVSVTDGAIKEANEPRLDGYDLPQNVTPLAGGFYVGNLLHRATPTDEPFASSVTLGAGIDIAAALDAQSALDTVLLNTIQLSSETLGTAGLGGLRVAGKSIHVASDLAVANGGEISMRAETIDVDGNITARSGIIALDAFQVGSVGSPSVTSLDIAEGVTLDTRGLWVNLLGGGDRRDLAHLAGGDILLASRQGSLRLGKDSLLDASAGGAIMEDGKTAGAAGGDVALLVDGTFHRKEMNELVLGGDIRSYGSEGNAGGTLTIAASGRPITIGDAVLGGGEDLMAGEALPMDLQLLEDIILKAGMEMPIDFFSTIDTLYAGDISPNPIPVEFYGLTLESDWIIPAGIEVFDQDWNYYMGGDLLPQGTFVEVGYGYLPAGPVPADIMFLFPNGISLNPPITNTIKAGEILTSDLTLAAGTTIKKGNSLSVDAKFAKPLHLAADFFQKGFSRYDVSAGGDIQVRGDTTVDVVAPVRRINIDSRAIANGASPEDAMETWLPDMFVEDAQKGRFIQRQGASLSLRAYGLGDALRANPYSDSGPLLNQALAYGDILVDPGAVLRVDDGQSITLDAAEKMLIAGRIEARSGSVALTAGPAENMNRDRPNAQHVYDPTRAIWLETGSVVDVSGRALSGADASGLRFASVSDGGDIHIGGNPPKADLAKYGDITSAYIVLRPGSLLDASGASAETDYLYSSIPDEKRTALVATDGGTIALHSQYGIFLDGEMRAAAGGEGASGGLLSVRLTTPYLAPHGNTGTPQRNVPEYMRRLRSIMMDETYQPSLAAALQYGDCITGCWVPGQALAESVANNAGIADLVGQARIGVDRIAAGGFGSLTLKTDDVILLNGAIDLDLSRNLTLSGTIANLDLDAAATLSAAYVNFVAAGSMSGMSIVDGNIGLGALFKRPEIGDGSLTIKGGLVDMGEVQFGVNGAIGLMNGGLLEYEYAAPRTIDIISQSDIRLTGGDVNALSNISLTAAQIYPITGAKAGIYAGKFAYKFPNNTSNYITLMDGGTVGFHRLEGATPAAPLSVYGNLTVGADIINQGGFLRAPLGAITLGVGGSAWVPGPDLASPGQNSWGTESITTSEVNLLPGSMTSVSAASLVVPYGGTTDGLTWMLNGVALDTTKAYQGITVVGSLRADEGSVIDLSGGGTPGGAGFIPGRGGSVDVLQTALANANPAYRGLSDAKNKVYALVPDYQLSATPLAIDGHAQPGVGQQIVIPDGMTDLPAGTYTLLPAEYALMKGGYRVEIGKAAGPGASGIARMDDGSIRLILKTGIAHTDAQSATTVSAILTSGEMVRQYSQYNEMNFGDFLIQIPSASLFDLPMPLLPQDGKQFILALATPEAGDTRPSFSFKGKGIFSAAEGGLGGSLAVIPGNYYGAESYTLEILADGDVASAGNAGLYASDLNVVGASIMTIGGTAHRILTTLTPEITILAGGGEPSTTGYSPNGFDGVTLRSGAELKAPQVMLITASDRDLLVENGARITTIGMGDPAFDSTMGYTLRATGNVLAVSNGLLEFTASSTSTAIGSIVVEDGASLHSEGTLAFVTPASVSLGEKVNYGARYLGFSTGSVNIGSSAALASAAGSDILPAGIALNQSVLDRLMLGDESAGAPALERLILTASQSINFYGSVNLDTRDAATGKSALQLVLNSPAIYGHGTASDTATIQTGTLVWNGMLGTSGDQWNRKTITALPGSVIAGGAGTGSGMLNFLADRIVIGYQDGVPLSASLPLDRLALGFGTVNLVASDRIESNHEGTFAVYQSQAVFGEPGVGGNLNLTTPLLTGAAGSVMEYTAGGAIALSAPAGAAPLQGRADAALGAEVHLTAATINANTLIALPSGKLGMMATQGNITLADGARIDMAGKSTDFFDETRYSWGGDVELESAHGNVTQSAGSQIDLSADYNHAGVLKVTAFEGAVTLDGTVEGHARNGANQPDPSLRNGGIDIRAGSLSDFAGLNQRLNNTRIIESRSFVVKTGDIVIGDEVTARNVTVSADGGSLTVNGVVHANGAKPGSIRLSARDNLTLASLAVLDARGTALQVDVYGAPIEASNRATVELASSAGTLTLSPGATIDLSSPDNVARGRIELNAARAGANDVAIAAGGPLTIKGAESLSVNAFRSYEPVGGVIDQALLDTVHGTSDTFITAALANGGLMGRMAGLAAYGDISHLRPGVELVSAAGGSLRVSGDLNLAGHRYASLNPNSQRTAAYGSGEAGVLLIRAADDLDIYGSITDGFAEPARTPDDNGWVLYPGDQIHTGHWYQDYKLPSAVVLGEGSTIPGGVKLTFDAPVDGFTVQSSVVLGAETQLAQSYVLAQDWVATADIGLPDGSMIARGTIMPTGTSLPADSTLGVGTALPLVVAVKALTWPKGVPLPVQTTLSASTQLQVGDILPRNIIIVLDGVGMEAMRPTQADGTQGRIWATATMLPQESQSWSMRLVSGADTSSADGRTLRAASDLAEDEQNGDLTLSDRHYLNPQASGADGFDTTWLSQMRNAQNFSVIRTGIGSLDLLAGGSYEQLSLYGIYTAGTPSAEVGGTTPDGYNVYNQPRAKLASSNGLANPWIGSNFDDYVAAIQDYQAWYPEHGGDVRLVAQGRLTGYSTGAASAWSRVGSGTVGNWLWRQGAYGVTDGIAAGLGQDTPTAWWINFGGYVPNAPGSLNNQGVFYNMPILQGFMGVGTLGGGNLTVAAGGDAGVHADWSLDATGYADTNRAGVASTGLNLAVASTGRVLSVDRNSGVVVGGSLVQTGGGDMDIRLGGKLNAGASKLQGSSDMNGTFVNLRGDIDILARSIGGGTYSTAVDLVDPRRADPLRPAFRPAYGGITLVIGDSHASLNARGDLILAGVGDPGATTPGITGASFGYVDGNGQFVRPDGWGMQASFSLWQADSSISLFSAGGNITPTTMAGGNGGVRDGRYWYPPILSVTASSGSIYWDGGRCGDLGCDSGIPPIELSPSPLGQVEFLAAGSILGGGTRNPDNPLGSYAAGLPIALSGMSADLDLLPNPFRPVWSTFITGTPQAPGTAQTPFAGNNGIAGAGSNLAFQKDTAAGTLLNGQKKPALFYAAGGDISNLNFGYISYDGMTPQYANSGAAEIRASRDIVNLGTGPGLGCGLAGPIDCRSGPYLFGVFDAGGLVVHNDPRDISVISAGRDIIYANMNVAGPGNLIVEAGRNIYQADKGRLTSVGPLFDLTPTTRNGGAGITVLTGVGAGGPNYDAFANLYLNPANLAEVGRPLADQDGKVVHSYEKELTKWLDDRFGFKAVSNEEALAYFGELASEQRNIFVRSVYFDELKAGGREYNDADGARFGSYLRGRDAIAALFPAKDAQGNDLSYAGDLTMFGGSGVRTLFGGNVEILVAGGQTTIGVGGIAPPSTAGVLSMGSGDIDIYSLGSVLLGQSRVFTTFGGDLFIWSAEGDINAGRGSRSTAVYQPPRRVYDLYGNVTLSPPTQNTGAGIATLNPIPEISAGDVDLIAPLGTIDAGEAGIRVSGDVNLAALRVVNAANIDVQGDATGIPIVAAVNTGALTAASNAASAVSNAAARIAERTRPQSIRDIPSIITGRLLGFGE